MTTYIITDRDLNKELDRARERYYQALAGGTTQEAYAACARYHAEITMLFNFGLLLVDTYMTLYNDASKELQEYFANIA